MSKHGFIIVISIFFMLATFSCKTEEKGSESKEKSANKTEQKTDAKAEDKSVLETSGIKTINVNEFEKLIKKATDPQIVDVRTEFEHKIGHLTNSQNLDFYNAEFIEKVKELDATKPCFVYCQSGGRSAAAAKLLEQSGFKEIYDMEGGFTAWKAANKSIAN